MPVAITVTEQFRRDLELVVRGTMVFSGAYPAGGEPISFANCGIRTNKLTPKNLDIAPVVPSGALPFYDYTNAKCMFFMNTAGGANNPLGEHTAATYVASIISPLVWRYELVLAP